MKFAKSHEMLKWEDHASWADTDRKTSVKVSANSYYVRIFMLHGSITAGFDLNPEEARTLAAELLVAADALIKEAA